MSPEGWPKTVARTATKARSEPSVSWFAVYRICNETVTRSNWCSNDKHISSGHCACIGWIITDQKISCYTVSSVYDCVIKEGLCYWGSKTLLREIWNGEAWSRQHFGRRVPTMDLRGENLSKLNSRSPIDLLQMKRSYIKRFWLCWLR